MSKSKHSDSDRNIAIGSLLLATAAIVISILSYLQTERFNKTTIRPYIVFNTIAFSKDGAELSKLSIENHGLGPAIIRSIIVDKPELKLPANMASIEYWDAVVNVIKTGFTGKCFIEYGAHGNNYVLSPDSYSDILMLSNNCSNEDKKIFVDFIIGTRFIVNYESINGDKFVARSKN